MSSPLDKTFSILAQKDKPESLEALEVASVVPLQAVQMRAVKTLLKKRSLDVQVNLIKNWKSFLPEVQAEVERRKDVLNSTVKRTLRQPDPTLQLQALEFVVGTSDYAQIDTLLLMMQNKDQAIQKQLVMAERQLVDQFYDELQQEASNGEIGAGNSQLNNQHKKIISQLNELVRDLEDSDYADFVIESLLILGTPESINLDPLFNGGSRYLRKTTNEMLMNSKHPGVMQFIVDSMKQAAPNAYVMESIRQRQDPEFVNHLLTELPSKLNSNQVKNFKKIDSLEWAKSDSLLLDAVLPALHLPLIRLLNNCSLPVDDLVETQKWLIHNSSPEVRLAATEVLASVDNSSVEGIFDDSLSSANPQIQAWATTQIRHQNIPHRFDLLLERIDSELPEVRESAREELKSFNLELMYGIFHQYPVSICRQAGQLLKKLEPHVLEKLTQKICTQVPSRKIRAAQCAHALGLHQEVLPALTTLLTHTDSLVRRAGVEILGDIPTKASYELLVKMQHDPSQRVQGTTIKALRHLQETLQNQVTRDSASKPQPEEMQDE